MAEVKKNSFLMFCDWKTIIDGMTDEQVGHIVKGLFSKLTGGEYTFTKDTASIANYMLEQIEKSNSKYEATCKRKSEAAKKRAEKLKHLNTVENIPKHSNTFENIPKHSNTLGDNDNEYDNENDNEYENDNENDNENEINTITKDNSINSSFFLSNEDSSNKKERKKEIPPIFSDVKDFFHFDLVNEGYCVDVDEPDEFYELNTNRDWKDRKGQPIKNWKVYARLWHIEHKKRQEVRNEN